MGIRDTKHNITAQYLHIHVCVRMYMYMRVHTCTVLHTLSTAYCARHDTLSHCCASCLVRGWRLPLHPLWHHYCHGNLHTITLTCYKPSARILQTAHLLNTNSKLDKRLNLRALLCGAAWRSRVGHSDGKCDELAGERQQVLKHASNYQSR